VTETEFQQAVITAAKLHGIAYYHTFDSRRSNPGFPDLVLVGEHGVAFRELKSPKGRITPEQRYWLQILTAAGQDAMVWRPDDWPVHVLDTFKRLGKLTIQPPPPSQAQIRAMLGRRGFDDRRARLLGERPPDRDSGPPEALLG